ncbi:hypothetical protein [Streptomyces sp. GC420]|uniref:hypothetical protein n=1 Tax=Streptomyces sp. GC420 TaxID=2697568 RepID=UPI001414F46C|nr:hypothetical protein [Streptomyces sp. GC420]NBM18187.1 hypothetical protein [Streptomyces sp. GC420]
MKRSAVRRSAVAASVSLLSLALLTGCSGSDSSGKDDKGKQEDKASQPAEGGGGSDAKPLSAAELEKAALTKADVKKSAVEEPPEDEILDGKVKTDDDACLPLADAVAGVVAEGATAKEYRQVTAEPEIDASALAEEDADASFESAFDVTTTLVSLAAYDGEDKPEAALKALNEAVTACQGGFGATLQGEDQEVTEVAKESGPTGGDESLAVTITAKQDGASGPMKLVVVRKGTTLAYFTAINLASMSSGKDFDFPADLFEAQMNKLG